MKNDFIKLIVCTRVYLYHSKNVGLPPPIMVVQYTQNVKFVNWEISHLVYSIGPILLCLPMALYLAFNFFFQFIMMHIRTTPYTAKLFPQILIFIFVAVEFYLGIYLGIHNLFSVFVLKLIVCVEIVSLSRHSVHFMAFVLRFFCVECDLGLISCSFVERVVSPHHYIISQKV